MTGTYEYALDISSQFPFCGIPLRLDSYSTCQFACRYCFASARGGRTSDAKMKSANAASLSRRFKRLARGEPASALDEFLKARIPIHFGGMSDPFMPLEATERRSLEILAILANHNYPTLVSTKGNLVADRAYLELLRQPNFIVQISISCARDGDSAAIDAGAPLTSERFAVLQRLADAGVKTAVRIQPLFPMHLSQAPELISRSAGAHARHVAVEFLKLPLERSWDHRERLSGALGVDLAAYYVGRGAQRVGREWILPVQDRLPAILHLREIAHRAGLSFGAGDNDLLHLSDGAVCCSGADLLGLGAGYRHNFLTAVSKGILSKKITITELQEEWRPVHSIVRHINSHSRGGGGTMERYIRSRWNGVTNGPSPLTFYGVRATDQTDADGFRIYEINEDLKEIYKHRWNEPDMTLGNRSTIHQDVL